ncbi:MAG: formylglycine-generating enzyme family protein, partial [Oscillospiraceae bacterium]|nr:formylglycine-generating enzyme family protein [Oscillospiraceae bacterium]
MKKICTIFLSISTLLLLSSCGIESKNENEVISESAATASTVEPKTVNEVINMSENVNYISEIPEKFVLIEGGTFEMGSPDTEAWRSEDETQHTVTVSDFCMSIFEVTQSEYSEVMGINPSNFKGDELPVENVTWLDAVNYCNTRSQKEGLTPAYTIDGNTIAWDRSANGYRLPTEAEWEYA